MKHPINEIHPFPEKNSLSLSPGEWRNSTGLDAQSLGIIAQAFICENFKQKSRLPKSDYYIDDSFAGKIDKKYVEFIINKNSKLNPRDKNEISRAVMQRPDILVHSRSLCEYYEIKPHSIDGMLSGDKIYSINLSMYFFGLPYKRGLSFLPDPVIPIGSIIKDRKTYEFSLITGLIKAGLIAYRFCVSTDKNNNISFEKNSNVGKYFQEYISMHLK